MRYRPTRRQEEDMHYLGVWGRVLPVLLVVVILALAYLLPVMVLAETLAGIGR